MEDCPDVPWQSGNGDQEGVDEHFVVGYRVALKKKRFLSAVKMKHTFQELIFYKIVPWMWFINYAKREGRGFARCCVKIPHKIGI